MIYFIHISRFLANKTSKKLVMNHENLVLPNKLTEHKKHHSELDMLAYTFNPRT